MWIKMRKVSCSEADNGALIRRFAASMWESRRAEGASQWLEATAKRPRR